MPESTKIEPEALVPETEKVNITRQRIYSWLVYGLSVFILIFGWMIFVRPEVQRARELSGFDVETLDRSVQQKQEELIRIKRLSSSLELLPSEIQELLLQALPREVREPDLLVNLEGLGEVSGLDLLSVQIQDAVKTSGDSASKGEPDNALTVIKRINLGVRYKGISYTILKSFLRNIERNLRITQVNSFSFNPSATDIDFDLTSFYFDQ